LRPSGTAPKLRCFAGASTPDAALQLCEDCLGRVAQAVTAE